MNSGIPTEQRTAIVTGAARGIGAATAKRLATDGFAVAVLDLDSAATGETVAAIEKAGGRALGVGVDVTDPASVDTAVAMVAAELGDPLVLVNNAGITRDNLLFKMTEDDWDAVVAVHLRGSFLMSRAAQRYMVAARWGRIVNVSSTSALGNRGQANYAAAKAGFAGGRGRDHPGRPGRATRRRVARDLVLRQRGRGVRLRPGALRRRWAEDLTGQRWPGQPARPPLAQIGSTWSAWGPLAPWVISKVTRWFSSSERYPLDLIAEWWTNTSEPPPSGVMNPNPFSALNHLTVPCTTAISPYYCNNR